MQMTPVAARCIFAVAVLLLWFVSALVFAWLVMVGDRSGTFYQYKRRVLGKFGKRLWKRQPPS